MLLDLELESIRMMSGDLLRTADLIYACHLADIDTCNNQNPKNLNTHTLPMTVFRLNQLTASQPSQHIME